MRTKRRTLRRAKKKARLVKAGKTFLKAIKNADKRGYTGMVGSKGAYLDDPAYKRAAKHMNKVLARKA